MLQQYDPVESSVVGGALLSDDLPPEAALVDPAHFDDPKMSQIWSAILGSYEDRRPHDECSIAARLGADGYGNMAPLLCDIVDATPTTANLDHWCRVLAERGRKRLLQNELCEISQSKGDPDETAARLELAIRDAQKQRAAGGGLVHVKGPLKALLAELEQEWRHPGEQRIAATGIVDIDEMVELRAGELTLIAARPGMGKSALAGAAAAYCAKDKTRGATALFSLEMSAASLMRRMVAAEARIPTKNLVKSLTDPRLVSAFDRVHQLGLLIDDRSGLSVDEIRTALRRVGKVRLVVIDYLQLARMDGKLERQDIRVGDVAKRLKWMAKEFDCHVIALSQLNRQVEQRNPPRPVMSDLRDSGNLEEHADNVLLLYREAAYNTNADEHKAEVIVGKQRGGRTGAVTIGWAADRQQFYAQARGGEMR